MIRYIDIDGTLAVTHGLDYANAIPITYRINAVNRWFEMGEKIIIWTARGQAPTRSLKEKEDIAVLTAFQLKQWNVKYHELRMDKPLYDLFIDDRAINADHYKAWL